MWLVFGLVLVGSVLLAWRGKLRFLPCATIPVALVAAGGGRAEAVGLGVGLLILSVTAPKKGIWPWVQGGLAALAAALCGYRVEFLTHPAGGYLYLYGLSIPFTVLWVLVVLRSRDALRQVIPRPALQHGIDFILVSNAILLALVSPAARAEPLALCLPFALLGLVLVSTVAAYRGENTTTIHRAVAFGLSLFAIGGVMKGPLSLALLLPLALTGIPVSSVSHAVIAQSGVGASLGPEGLLRWRYSQGTFALCVLVLASGLALGVVLAVSVSPAHGLLAAGVVPLLVGARILRRRLIGWLHTCLPRSGGGRRTLLGVGFDDLSLGEAVARAEAMLTSAGRGHIVVTPNSISLLQSLRREDLLAVYRQADLVTADGIGIVWASRLLGVPLGERVCGIDFAESLLERASIEGHGVFLLGGREGVGARAAEWLTERFPGLRVVGSHHGYFNDSDELIQLVRQARPEILLVGMGVPRQELWMAREKDRLGVPLLVGVGGALDVWSGDRRRAPLAWQRQGLEWLYRLLHEPRRLRDALLLPRFVGQILALRAAIEAVSFLGRSAGSKTD